MLFGDCPLSGKNGEFDSLAQVGVLQFSAASVALLFEVSNTNTYIIKLFDSFRLMYVVRSQKNEGICVKGKFL